MPTISMFYGIVIMMYHDDHNPPHFHARYHGFNASFTFDGELLKGEMPRKQHQLITAWARIHQDELIANWDLAKEEEQLFRINPLQ